MTVTLDPPGRVGDTVDSSTRREFVIGAAALAAMLAGGCGSTDVDPSAGSSASPGFPRTVTHAGGELVVPEQPERVIVSGPYSELDVLLALGVIPEAYGDDGSPLRPWQLTAGARDVGTFAISDGPNPESVAATGADLVVMNGPTYANYPEWVDTYSQVCPVLGMPAGIEDQLALVAEALNLDQASLVQSTRSVQAAFDGFAPAWRPTSIAVVNYFGEVYVWTDKSPHSMLMERLGLPALTAPAAEGDDPDAQGRPLSFELLGLIDTDLLLVSADGPNDEFVAELEANPVFTGLNVVREGRYARLLGDEAIAVGDVTALSLPAAVAAMERVLKETKPR